MGASVNGGLCTCSSDPVPRATPRTNVVLPEPRGPASSTRSPAFKRDPVSSPSASVSAAEAVVTSRKVVVATPRNLGAFENHCALPSEDANGGEPCAANDVLTPDPYELHLPPPRQRVLPRCSCRAHEVADLPRPWPRARRHRPGGSCTLRRKGAEREGQRAPPGVFGGHPVEAERDAFDRHVSADDGERARLSQDRGMVAGGQGAEVRLDELEQLELARPTDCRHASSIARRRRAAASGSGASPIALITHTRCNQGLPSS